MYLITLYEYNNVNNNNKKRQNNMKMFNHNNNNINIDWEYLWHIVLYLFKSKKNALYIIVW